MKTCEVCERPLVKRKKEAYWQFEARRYRSRPCAHQARGIAQRVVNEEFKARYRQITAPDGRKMLEHRYVMEQVIGRRLLRTEQVHHKNHDRLDNRPENLELVTSGEHGQRHTHHPVTKTCVTCGAEFAPHKTKRARTGLVMGKERSEGRSGLAGDAAALTALARLGVRDPAHMLGPVQVVGDLGDLGRARVAGVVTDQLLQLVPRVFATPDEISQFGHSLAHLVHASHGRTSRSQIMTRHMTRITLLDTG